MANKRQIYSPMIDKPGSHLRYWLLLLAIVLLSVAASNGETRIGGEERFVPLSVIDRDGKAVLGLTAEQIRVRGIKADWRLTFDDGPRRIVLLFEASGGGYGGDFVRGFLQAVAPHDEVAFHGEHDGHKVVVPFTQEKTTILAALNSLQEAVAKSDESKKGDGTKLSDNFLAAVNTALGFGDAVIAITSCGSLSITHAVAALRPLGRRGVRFLLVHTFVPNYFPVLLGRKDPIELAAEAVVCELFKRRLHETVQSTGGLTFDSLHKHKRKSGKASFFLLGDFWEELGHEAYGFVKNTYRLELTLEGPLKKKKKLKVVVRDKRVKKQFKPKLFSPRFFIQNLRPTRTLPPDRSRQRNEVNVKL